MDDNGVNHIPSSVTAMKPVNCLAPRTVLFGKNCRLWSQWCEQMVSHLESKGLHDYYVHREEDENGLWYCCICRMEP